MNPVALRETLRFVEPLLGRARRVLDVGSGRGELVQALRDRGFEATGIDKEQGTDFLDYESGPFEAILFVASLHHIAPLEEAVARAHRLLLPGGVLIADEFDVEAPDEPTARFWQKLTHDDGDALEQWRHHHAHHGVLASGQEMREAIAARFALREPLTAPYLYRYLDDEAADESVFLEESRLIAKSAIKPVGLRLWASP